MKKIIVVLNCIIFTNSFCLAQSFPTVQGYHTVTTPMGSAVEAIDFYPLNQAQINQCNEIIGGFDGITITENPTSDYNCHGWA